jgi:hypothetical protein
MYGKWLFKEIKTEYGLCKVEIFRKNFTDTAIEIGALESNSLTLAMENLGNITDPIGKSVCSFSIIDTDQIDYDEFFTPDATAYMVVVSTKTGEGAYVTRWSGYVTPDFFAENLSYRTPISISARDNIGYLNDVDFDLDASTITVRGLIEAAFNRIAEDYPMQIVFATQKQTAEGILAIDATISTMLLREGSWYEAIETVLHDLGLQMRWVDNNTIAVLDLSQIPEYYATQAFNFVDASGYREILPAWRELSQKQDYGLRENFFEGQFSSENLTFVKSQHLTIPDLFFEQDVRYYTPNNWGVARDIYTTDPSFYNATFGEKIIFSAVSKDNPATTYLSWQTNILKSGVPLTVKFNALNTIVYPFGGYNPYPLQLKVYDPFLAFGSQEGDGLQIGLRMNLFLHTKDHKTYVMNKEWVEDDGTGSGHFINFTLDKISLDSYQYEEGKGFFPIGVQPAEKELSIVANTIPYDGVLELRIYGYYVVNYKYGADNVHNPNFDKFFTHINNVTYTFESEDISTGQDAGTKVGEMHNVKENAEYKFGQVAYNCGGINAYAGGLFDAEGRELLGFQRNANATSYNLLELVGREVIHFNKKNYNKLSGTIRNLAKEPLMFNRLFVRNGKRYAPFAYSLDIISNQMEITTMQEVENYVTESFSEINSAVTTGGAIVSAGNNTVMQYSQDAGNTKRIYELTAATEEEKKDTWVMIDGTAFPEARKINVKDLEGLNEEQVEAYLTEKKYATQSWVKGITDDLETDIANRVLVTDFEKVDTSVKSLLGYFDNSGNANNALKLGGQLPSYYATKSALDTTNGNVVSLTQKMGTAESGISTNKTNIASLTTDLSNLTSRVSTAEGTIKGHTDAIALNANNIASNANNIAFNAKSITAIQSSYVDKSSAQEISGVKTFKNGLKIGEAELVWDSTNKALKIVGSAYITKDLSFGGYQAPGGGGTSGGGIVTIKVNGQEYTSQNGIVTLPSYPSLAGYATEDYVTSRGYITNAALNGYAKLTDIPTSLPASDVYAWAKAVTKPTYTASEVGALSISGGTISSSHYQPLIINSTYSAVGDVRIAFSYNGDIKGLINWDSTTAFRLYNYISASYIGVKDDGTPCYNGYTLYHTGNFNPANYLPKSGGTINGALEINHNGTYPLLVNGADSYSVLQFTARSNRKAEVGWLNDDRGSFAFLFNVNSMGALSVNAHGAYFSPTASDFAKYPILHSNNYKSYTYSQSTIDSKLAGYLPLTGGVISAASIEPLMLNNTIADSHCYMHFQVAGVTKAYVGWSVPVGAFLQEGSDWLSVKGGVVSFNANTLIHTGNYANTTDTRYLKLSGGTLTGGLTISSGNFIVSTTAGDTVVNQLYPTVDNTYVLGLGTRRWSSLYTVLINGYTPIHSGNIDDYTLFKKAITKLIPSDNLNDYTSGYYGWRDAKAPINGVGANTAVLAFKNERGLESFQLEFDANGAASIRFRKQNISQVWTSWKNVAFTDSNVESANKLQTARTIWGQSFDGSGDVAGDLDMRYSKITFATSANDYHIGWGSGNMLVYKNYYGHYFITNDTERMRINQSGNVLIGTTTDNGSKFQVNGTAPSYFYNSNTRYSLVVDSGLASKIIAFGGWDNSEKAQVGYTDGTGFNIFNYQSYRDNNYGEKITGVGITNTGIFYVANSGNPGPNTATLKVETSLVTVIGNLTVTGDITFGSDARYKNKITDVEIDLATIANAPLFIYKWNDREDNREHLGTTAQYWFDTAFKNAVIPTNDEKLWTMSYSEIAIGNTIILAREQIKVKSRVEVLEEKVKQLEDKLEKYRRVA